MSVGPLAPNFANAISPFSPVGKQSVGEESKDSKNSTLKAVERSADSARTGKRRRRDLEEEAVEALPERKQGNQERNPADEEADSDVPEKALISNSTLIPEGVAELIVAAPFHPDFSYGADCQLEPLIPIAAASNPSSLLSPQPNYSLDLQLRQRPQTKSNSSGDDQASHLRDELALPRPLGSGRFIDEDV